MRTSYEKNLIINNKELKYTGIFREEEIFSTINRVLGEKNYEKREKKTEEVVLPEGKNVFIELRPRKEKTKYITLMIKIKIKFVNMIETLEDFEGEKRNFQKGNVFIAFDSWSLTDYESRWGMKPFNYFMKGIINKYLYRLPLESGFMDELVSDTNNIYKQLKELFKSYQPKSDKLPSEEEVRIEVEKEIGKGEK